MSCSAVFCSSRTTKGGVKDPELSFHSFPRCPEIRNQWIKAVRRDNWEPTKFSRLCSKHFEKSSFIAGLSIKKLKTDAMPTIFEGYPKYHQSVVKRRKPRRIQAREAVTEDISLTPIRANTFLKAKQPQTKPLQNPSPGDESDHYQVDDDDSIYERDVSPIRTEEDAEPTVSEGSSRRRHEGYRCDVCRGHIVGFRYACVECANFDLCGACEARAQHALHYVLRVPAGKLHTDVRAVIKKIREELLKKDNIKESNVEENSIKIEINEEDLKQEDPLGQAAEPLQRVGSQDIQYDQREDSETVKYLGLSEDGGRPPVFEDPLYHPPAVSKVLSRGPKMLVHQTQVLTNQPQVVSHQPALLYHQPETLSEQPSVPPNQPKIQSKVKSKVPKAQSHMPKVLSHQPAVLQVLSYQPATMSHKSQVLSHQPPMLSNHPSVLSNLPKFQSKVPKAPSPQFKVLSHQPEDPQALSHETQAPQTTSHSKRLLTLEVRGLDTVRALAGGQGLVGARGGAERGSYAVYTHCADQSEEPTSAGEQLKPTQKKKKK